MLTRSRRTLIVLFVSIVVATPLVLLGAVAVPLAGLGMALGRQLNLGAPLIAALLSRQPGSLQKLRRDAGVPALVR